MPPNAQRPPGGGRPAADVVSLVARQKKRTQRVRRRSTGPLDIFTRGRDEILGQGAREHHARRLVDLCEDLDVVLEVLAEVVS